MSSLEYVAALLAFDAYKDLSNVHSALAKAGLRQVRETQSLSECVELGVSAKPDVLIMGLTLSERPTIQLLRDIRHGKNGLNRYMPIIIAARNPTGKMVRMVLNGGAHEFLALPTTDQAAAAVVNRAVFVGRPFVECASYTGPCRRRRPMDFEGEDRRKNDWPGYVHASHQTAAE